MKKNLLFLLIYLSILNITKAQCFECIISQGGHTDDYLYNIKKANNGFLMAFSGMLSPSIDGYPELRYYDNNCNMIWEKKYQYDYHVSDVIIDNNDNSYVLENGHVNAWSGGRITKYDQNGNNKWKITFSDSSIDWKGTSILINYYIFDQHIYLVGVFGHKLVINGNTYEDFSDLNIHGTFNNAYIAKFDLDGQYVNHRVINDYRYDEYLTSQIDDEGNIYTIKSFYKENKNSTVLEKHNKDLNHIFSKTLSTSTANSSFKPLELYFTNRSKQLILLASYYNTVNVDGIKLEPKENFVNNTVLFNINQDDGFVNKHKILNYIKKFKNDYVSFLDIAENSNKTFLGTGFDVVINIGGTELKPKRPKVAEGYEEDYYNRNLFVSEFDPVNLNLHNVILATNTGEIEDDTKIDNLKRLEFLKDDELLVGGIFSSLNFEINNIHIPNKSGNGDDDFFVYKYNFENNPSNIDINIENSCYGEKTSFIASGEFDSIKWDFGDGNFSTNKIAENHYNNPGKYIVKVKIICKGEEREFIYEINIKKSLILNSINDFVVCENNANEGIGTFDTTSIPLLLTNNQKLYDLKFYNENNIEIPDFINTHYKNTTKFEEKIIVRGYFLDNSTCISETSFYLKTSKKSEVPTIKEVLIFCKDENKRFKDLQIEGDSLSFYDINSNLIDVDEIITTGNYYVTQKNVSSCESNKLLLNINIQETTAPSAELIQTFCSYNNPIISDISILGENVIWYETPNSSSPLPINTILEDGRTYFASQTINNCESTSRTSVIVNITNFTLLNSTPYIICKDFDTIGIFDLNQKKKEIATLLNVNENEIIFYKTFSDAQQNLNPLNENFSNLDNSSELYASYLTTDLCKTYVKITLIENINPKINLEKEYYKCKDNTIEISLDSTYKEILWSTGETTDKIIINKAGNYSVTVKNDFCSITHEFEIKNYDDISINYIYNGVFVQFSAINYPTIESSLDGINWSKINSFTLEPGLYTFYFKNTNGCIEVQEIYLYKDVQSFISPNGDGINDYWDVSYIKDLKSVSIFDRNGRTIFNKSKDQKPLIWDGKSNGYLLPSDSYWYIIHLENGEKIEGSIILKNK